MPFDPDQPSHRALRAIVAERTRPLLAWTGAGISAPAGLPSWFALRDRLVEVLEHKALTLDTRDRARFQNAAHLARQETNLWLAFGILQKNLGATTFRGEIRDALKHATDTPIPAAYERLARMRIRGILNLNLDRLAARALVAHDLPASIVEKSGREIGRLTQIITDPPRFVGNMHGSVEAIDTWVFTARELKALQEHKPYSTLVSTLLSMHTVIFLGISTDDLATGGFLERLADLKIETPPHFWLTERNDADTDIWAEAAGIRVIRYEPSTPEHPEVVEFLDDLISATPSEPTKAPPVTLGRADPRVEPIPPPEDLVSLDAEQLRKVLNAHASNLLANDAHDTRQRYETFSRDYDQAIYRAWYTSSLPGGNELLGYKLNREVARGAFGRVYQATSPRGTRVAVKVLLEDIRRDTDLLLSFRRGVRSMRILAKHGVEGMVEYVEASEIPAFVVMDWIDGPNLAEAKASRYIEDWSTILRISNELTAVIRRAHELPERVLHRDIRPSNVMLKDYFTAPDNAPVVVLDFDLSWHRDSYEVSVIHSTMAGYLAPEQIRKTQGTSTRSATVDSFGLGMTFLFMCTGIDPLPDEHRHTSWHERVKHACESLPTSAWKSTPERFARLILQATQDKQSARWDLAEIGAELERLAHANAHPSGVISPDLLAEEVAVHTDLMTGYSWDLDTLEAKRHMPTGLECRVGADPQDSRIELSLSWAATGSEDRTGLEKYVTQGTRVASDRLRSSGWERVRNTSSTSSTMVTASLDVSRVQGRPAEVAESIDRAAEFLRFGSDRRSQPAN
jgi:serine/threonine protein kinase